MLSSRSRKAASLALVAAALIGARTASAADTDLGTAQILIGADAAARCSSAQVNIDYDVAYDAALQGYGVSAARLSGLDERCQGYDAIVTLSGPGGVQLAEMTAVVVSSEMAVVVPAVTPVGADKLTGVSVVLKEAEA